jgi:tellurite resistance protein TerC
MSDLALWAVLLFVVVGFLLLDLFVFHRDAHEVSLREAAAWSAVWIALGLGFGALVFLLRGAEAGGEYLAGYVLEKSLSIDNVFVFAMVFTYFAVPARYQHRVLFWGVVGAIVFRAIFIAAGAALIESFHVLLYGFGLLLLYTGWKMARSSGETVDPGRNRVLRLVRRVIPSTDEYDGQRFFTRRGAAFVATPLFGVLVVVETSDIMFAIDSIPAIFAITTDPFIVFSSNAFAILGLRSLYFLLAGMLHRFRYLKLGLAALLVFAGVKILLADVVTIPVVLTIAVIIAILGVAIAASMWATRRARAGGGAPGPDGPVAAAASHAAPDVGA